MPHGDMHSTMLSIGVLKDRSELEIPHTWLTVKTSLVAMAELTKRKSEREDQKYISGAAYMQ